MRKIIFSILLLSVFAMPALAQQSRGVFVPNKAAPSTSLKHYNYQGKKLSPKQIEMLNKHRQGKTRLNKPGKPARKSTKAVTPNPKSNLKLRQPAEKKQPHAINNQALDRLFNTVRTGRPQ